MPDEGDRLVPQDRGDNLTRRRALEWRPARNHLIQHHAQAEYIRADIHLLSARLFRRHIARSPDHYPGFGAGARRRRSLRVYTWRRRFDQLGEAEVEHFNVSVAPRSEERRVGKEW